MWDDSFLGCRVRGEGGITHRATRLSPVLFSGAKSYDKSDEYSKTQTENKYVLLFFDTAYRCFLY